MLSQVSETLARLVPPPEAPAGSPGGHELAVVVKEHSRKGERHAHVAEGVEAAAEQQPGQDEVAHDSEVAQDVDREGRGEGQQGEAETINLSLQFSDERSGPQRRRDLPPAW